MKDYDTLSDIINCEYLETETPELLITESPIIEKVLKIIFDRIKNDLKKKFDQTKVISELREDSELVDAFIEISEDLLSHIDSNFGELELNQEQESKIHPMWYLNK